MATAALIREEPQAASDTFHAQFRQDVLAGLSQARKAIPARWFYDHRGSELFEQITVLPEYYPTRTEVSILAEHCGEIARAVGPGRVVVEFGAGSATKTPLLLDCIAPAGYVPIDISGDFLRESCAPLVARYPDLPIHPVEADFGEPARLPAALSLQPRLGFFPGSTIGNMEPAAATDLLRTMRATLGAGSLLLIGMDRIKDEAVLTAAYDDAQGVTAEFNLNLAHRINRELDGSIPVEALQHRAVWNEARARIEMHLEARRDIAFEVAGRSFALERGETIHTENSHKYDERSGTTLLLAGGWEPRHTWMDADRRFMVILAQAIGDDQTA
ncbi:dimethylhistidine N-methyltransferase [Novosphingobium chloroacetimidivorans]|uniref:Dimethylhistidine N-methyltransferase n=1 Tax=Novosphingobium chloroacetimidivorans TaxID=1428314 RepID=A0A7W7NWH6_9SPHN|nr:L-histidine N(alpha)-methyltransferase [Novosphingobium chloroacetimidivorans]MBB4858424.1 dimethylhistidine N-methyltransferase [Novosphingobium chloroacetimidivorans]